MNLHDLQIPPEGGLLNRRLPRAAQGGIDTEPFFTQEMLDRLYEQMREPPRFVNPNYVYYTRPRWADTAPNIEVRAADTAPERVYYPTYRYRVAGDTQWRLPDRVDGVFLETEVP